jgi:hypothetical protein
LRGCEGGEASDAGERVFHRVWCSRGIRIEVLVVYGGMLFGLRELEALGVAGQAGGTNAGVVVAMLLPK